MSPSPPTLERTAGGLALLLMLVLLALTIGGGADVVPAPVIIIPTPALDTGATQLQAPKCQAPPDTLAPLAAPHQERE